MAAGDTQGLPPDQKARASRSARPGGPRRTAARVAAADLPVARVAVDVPLPHLDRFFDYLVPEPLAESAVPGCRVRVRFSGRLTGGYLVERAAASEHVGSLAFLERVVSPEPVLTPDLADLARAVADRYGGTLADVLRLAIPPRHAAAERRAPLPADQPDTEPGGSSTAADRPAPAGAPASAGSSGPWARYQNGPSFLAAVQDGRAPRAVWSALPGPSWPHEIALAAAAASAGGRGALIVVPDARDLGRVEEALTAVLGSPGYVSLSAKLGPAERYRRWLAVLRGHVSVVAGTRSAMFAPVAGLGLVVIWDDGDDLHAEPRAPYPHARDVLLLRAHRSGAAALIGGFARTAEAAQLLATRWARSLSADRRTVREHAPMVRTAGDDAELARDEAARTARMPAVALRTARQALETGPVLFQVPRRGYLAAVACQRCGTRVRCGACAGPVTLAGPGQPLRCGWCGSATERTCATCGDTGLRALVTGARRTAEELGRAFPGVPVHTSSGSSVLAELPGSPSVVIATPGAEPLAAGGYAAAVLLDSWALLGRPSLRAAEEALRRWMNAAALVRPGERGGQVVLMADPAIVAVQALIRWDAATHAERELAERRLLHFPPAVRIAALTGQQDAIEELLRTVSLPGGADVLGPVPARQGTERARSGDAQAGQAGAVSQPEPPAEPAVRFLVRAPGPAGTELAVLLRCGMAMRTSRKDQGVVRLQLDPAELI
jgi:primosomal protein N' (replication factor Y)